MSTHTSLKLRVGFSLPSALIAANWAGWFGGGVEPVSVDDCILLTRVDPVRPSSSLV